ncbi:MAG: hypothetical protein WAY93_06125 [Atopobiaceae bacterium]
MTVTIPNSEVNADYNISELTSGGLGGNGTFDIIMGAVNAHIDHQFKLGRIRGTDYANTYIQAMQMALQQASSYSIAKAKLPLELQQLEAQNHKIATDIAVMTKQGALYDAQIEQLIKETQLKEYELVHIKPLELANAKTEVEIKEQQIEVSKADLAIKQQQLELAKYQFTYQAPSEVAKTKSEADYYKYRAINEQAQTDPSVVMEGSTTALNNALIKEQSRQFMRSAQQGFLSEMIGSWKVRYNADPDAVGNGVDDENKLNDVYIGKVLSAYAGELGIVL